MFSSDEKYPFLAKKTSKSMNLQMDVCCIMTEFDEFSLTWV